MKYDEDMRKGFDEMVIGTDLSSLMVKEKTHKKKHHKKHKKHKSDKEIDEEKLFKKSRAELREEEIANSIPRRETWRSKLNEDNIAE